MRQRTKTKREPFTVRVPGVRVPVALPRKAATVGWVDLERVLRAVAATDRDAVREALAPFVGQMNEERTHAAMETVLSAVLGLDL